MCVYICIELCICVSLSLHICICIVMEQQITPSTTPTTFQKKEFQKPISYPSLPEEIFFPLSYFHPLLKCIDVSIYLYMCVYVHILFLHYLQVQQLKVTLFFFFFKRFHLKVLEVESLTPLSIIYLRESRVLPQKFHCLSSMVLLFLIMFPQSAL